MSLTVYVALLGWIPFVVLLFAVVRPIHRAVLVAYVAGWLFLPMAGFSLPGLPDYDKMFAANFGVAIGILLFDSGRLAAYRPSLLDLPVLVYCLVPITTSVFNGLGLHDGISGIFEAIKTWGVPFFVGRLYFKSGGAVRDLAIGLMLGGFAYAPFCVYEIRMSPQLHSIVYGFMQHSFDQTMRSGGYRPMVFMQHGIMLGLWMSVASLSGIWLYYQGGLRRIAGFPMWAPLLVLIVTTVLCKSFGALLLLLFGLSCLWCIKRPRNAWLLLPLVLLPTGYLLIRGTGIWDGSDAVAIAGLINEERAQSLGTRIENETMLAAKAMERPAFGWGGWGRARIYDDNGKDVSITDGLWIITFGVHGWIGLFSQFSLLLAPLLSLAFVATKNGFLKKEWVSVSILAVSVLIYAYDCIPNGMVNPLFTLIAGGLASIAAAKGLSKRDFLEWDTEKSPNPFVATARGAKRATTYLARQ